MSGDTPPDAGIAGEKESGSGTYPKTFSGKSFCDVDHIMNADKQYLFCRYWKPEKEIVALVFHIHGYAEHCGRSIELAERLRDLGIYSFAHDHIGHGESEGIRGHCDDYKIFVRDIWQHIDLIKSKYPDVPIFLYGHSMGGGLGIIIAHEKPGFFQGVLLSAPYVSPSPETATPFKVFMAKTIVHILPKLRVGKINNDFLSSDKNKVKEYMEDPLNDHDGMRASFAVQFLVMADKMKEIMRDIEYPFFVGHSEKDQICSIGGAKLLYEVSKSKDKTLKVYNDVLHMLEHEKNVFTKEYFDEVINWIKSRI